MPVSRFTTAAALALLACGAAVAGVSTGSEGAEQATWTPKELRFVYQGFTTRYSCDGLREKMRSVLLALGARKDLTVNESSCSSPRGGPDPFPGVAIKMQVLTLIPAGASTKDAGTVAAQWKTVDLRLDRDALAASGDCELLEQVRQSILPLFTTRNLRSSSNCVPHQLSNGGTQLRVETLVPTAPDLVPVAGAAH